MWAKANLLHKHYYSSKNFFLQRQAESGQLSELTKRILQYNRKYSVFFCNV